MQEQNKHSEKCRYNEDSKMLYALMEVKEGDYVLMSVTEVSKFEEYLTFARNDDRDVSYDLESNDAVPYKIVYGGLLLNKTQYRDAEIDSAWHKTANNIMDNLGCAYIDADSEENGNFTASSLDDVKFYSEKANSTIFIPFAALVKTHHVLHDSATSVSMFPYFKDTLAWEMMVNKPFILACRETAEIDGLTKDNWKEYISEDLLEKAYAVADLLTE